MRAEQVPLVTAARADIERRRQQATHVERWYQVLENVKDPEIPVLSIWDLGVLQDVQEEASRVTITITPTYSGCPAMDTIKAEIVTALSGAGASSVTVATKLSPAWTTDWMTTDARQRLRAYGVAPPDDLRCPQCDSPKVSLISEFGSTSCKALYRCQACLEPFDLFKAL